VKISLLASGSKGNSLFVDTAGSRLLIDAGLSASELGRRLSTLQVEPSSIDALLITHEHTDHVRGAGAFARKYRIPVVTSYATARSLSSHLKQVELLEFESGYSFAFRELMVDPVPLAHDATDPVGFVIESREGRIGIATDLGIVTRLVRDKLNGCQVLVLESNHDEEMLTNGPYPWHLKQRIKSRHGHISNTESMQLLEDLLHDGLKGVYLAHLSEVNNDPQLPHAAATALLSTQNRCAPRLFIGCQHNTTGLFEV
jgi:phosphoribosyl 1,2-cyclic phosphodiesterase